MISINFWLRKAIAHLREWFRRFENRKRFRWVHLDTLHWWNAIRIYLCEQCLRWVQLLLQLQIVFDESLILSHWSPIPHLREFIWYTLQNAWQLRLPSRCVFLRFKVKYPFRWAISAVWAINLAIFGLSVNLCLTYPRLFYVMLNFSLPLLYVFDGQVPNILIYLIPLNPILRQFLNKIIWPTFTAERPWYVRNRCLEIGGRSWLSSDRRNPGFYILSLKRFKRIFIF